MAWTHHSFHIRPVDGRERKPLAPLNVATRFDILRTLDISNDELATEWATTDWVRDARTESATDFTVDACHDIVMQLRRRWGMRRYVLHAANRTPVTWTMRLRGLFRCSHDLY
ncbi:hypothetical protein SDRG_11125 [Saprolegnia diclina VS20]|uniref:Uncharacterized protein n=1 Tax=Saprolegnia diclina (strain VS20) TaxID=1156394 RepID=T0RMK5_SAPDV|nr:hypothetical protein SDRG_11125 [Saprolegnia diclina VS20]EQC31202.1 hypothetical protein SDRG_11125 [Saprolegnia diclina VS20]|eukprot:XP_008615375.1 hypothetical protein SDRG_11125 [Saprolegnia diclina VS20]